MAGRDPESSSPPSLDDGGRQMDALAAIFISAKALPFPRDTSVSMSANTGNNRKGSYRASLMSRMTSLYVMTSRPLVSVPGTARGVCLSDCRVSSRSIWRSDNVPPVEKEHCSGPACWQLSKNRPMTLSVSKMLVFQKPEHIARASQIPSSTIRLAL